MHGGTVVHEARRRAGLRQAELAARVGTTQSAIARIERGTTEPSFRRVADLVAACGLSLVPQVTEPDAADWSLALDNLRLNVDARVRKHQAAVRFARAGQGAMRARD
jgi:ribosome-binding protein aMBF1 (putative translation factor)